MALAATVLCSGAALAQGPSDDPFGGGFPMNYSAEIFTMGAQDDSLHGWVFDWVSDLDSILMVGTDGFPESYLCGNIRDIAAAELRWRLS